MSEQLSMELFYGTKLLRARPITRADYNKFRGWELPADENGSDSGYLVEYQDGGKPNVAGFDGYVSWSPAEQFEKAYQPLNALSFGHALVALQSGYQVARAGWNGKGMWLQLVKAGEWELKYENESFGHVLEPFIGMKTANDKFIPWLASQADMLANDWQVLEA